VAIGTENESLPGFKYDSDNSKWERERRSVKQVT
jgi:hypothetical protein